VRALRDACRRSVCSERVDFRPALDPVAFEVSVSDSSDFAEDESSEFSAVLGADGGSLGPNAGEGGSTRLSGEVDWLLATTGADGDASARGPDWVSAGGLWFASATAGGELCRAESAAIGAAVEDCAGVAANFAASGTPISTPILSVRW